MANSSSGEFCNSSLLEIYSLNSFSSSNGKSQSPKGLCPVCARSGTLFCCGECVRNGVFMHSQRKGLLERFAEKKLRFYQLNEKRSDLLQRYENVLQKKIKAENLKKDILLCSEKIYLLKECIKCHKGEVFKLEKSVRHFKSENESLFERKARYKDKILSMEVSYESQRNFLRVATAQLNEIKATFKKCIRESIVDLMTDIFYISKVEDPKSILENLGESQCTALAEAQQTTYVKGHWEFTGTPDSETFYQILETYIPGNGDYSAYYAWTSKCHETVDLTDVDIFERNLCYTIGAALALTTQLVMTLSFYLDVPLPKQLCFSEFVMNELPRETFLHKVAKLNANVVHLCLVQNINPGLIKPQRTIENLLLLTDSRASDLGRLGPIEPTQRLSESMENVIIKDLLIVENEIEPGWDILCEMDDIESVPVYSHCAPINLPQQASQRPTTLTGDLISSVANIWRAATGQK